VVSLAGGLEERLRDGFAEGLLTSATFLTIETSVAAAQLVHGLVSDALAMDAPDDPVALRMYADLSGVQGAVETALKTGRPRPDDGGADPADA
jgi:hypothetical protein